MPLTTPILNVEMPFWLYAKTHRFLGVTGLIAYRSIGVRDSSTPYEGVKKVLHEHRWTTMETSKVQTKDMMDGWAELVLYALTAEMTLLAAELVSVWLDEIRAECQRFLQL